MKTIALFFILTLTAICHIFPDTTPAKSEKKPKARAIGTPIAFYSPETNVGIGLAGSFIFYLGEVQNTRPSSISPLLIYTFRKQFRTVIKTDLYFNANKLHLLSELKIEKYPNKFFGIGNNTQPENAEDYSSKNLHFFLSAFKRISRGMEIGLHFHFLQWNMMETDPQGLLTAGMIPGSSGGKVSGIGLLTVLDSRDNIFSPNQGHFLELEAKHYSGFLSSDFTFSIITLNLRKYIPIFKDHVLALQTLIINQNGDPPFIAMAQLGGERNMRGYYEGRYRNKNLLQFQAEYRLPLFWRFGMVLFAGAGNVADQFKTLWNNPFHLSYGLGVRFLFDKKERIFVRLDIGFGQDSTGFYITIHQAF